MGRVWAAGVAVVALWVIGAVMVGEPALSSPAPLAAAKYQHMPTVSPTTSVATAPPPTVPAVRLEAVGTEPAQRGDQLQVTPTDPPPPTIPTGLNGLPFASANLSGCDEMWWYANQAGLPEQFQWIGYEESRCLNDASSWCCHGYFQIHEGWIDWAPAAARACDVRHKDDYDATTSLAKQRSACLARFVFDEQGFCAWDVVPWC